MEQSILAGLAKAQAETPTRGVRRSQLRDVLAKHEAEIMGRLKAGYTRTALARILKEAGVGASLETIRAYLPNSDGKKSGKKKATTSVRPGRLKLVRSSAARQPEQQKRVRDAAQERPETNIPKIAPEPTEGEY